MVAFGPYEQHIVDFLLNSVREKCHQTPGSSIVDIGANIGTHSFAYSTVADRVISFEIHPRIYRVLQANVFGIPNIETHNVGVSDTRSTVQFSYSNTNAGASKIVAQHDDEVRNIESLRVIPLDEFEELDPSALVLVKIDVEGHEAHVIRGMRETLTVSSAVVAFEWDGVSSVFAELRNCGYREFHEVQTYRFPNNGFNRFKFVRILVFGLSLLRGSVPGLSCRLVQVNEVDKRHYSMILASK